MSDLEFAFPHFIGVGAPRAGTTWIYEVLRRHPAIWMPPIKELHYFDSLDPTVSFKRHTHKQSYRLKQFGGWRSKHYVADFARRTGWLQDKDKTQIKADFSWDKIFFGSGGDLDWYRALFRAAGEQGFITGEFTPDYAVVQPKIASKMSEVNPNLKIILMLREPVSRTWSNAVFYVTRRLKRPIDSVSDDDWITYCERKSCIERSDYAKMLRTLHTAFRAEQIFVGYYDEVVRDPENLVIRLMRYLGADADLGPVSDYLRVRVNAAAKTHKSDVPERVRDHLIKRWSPMLQEINATLRSTEIDKWLSSYTQHLEYNQHVQ